jgi:hypothetical protein
MKSGHSNTTVNHYYNSSHTQRHNESFYSNHMAVTKCGSLINEPTEAMKTNAMYQSHHKAQDKSYGSQHTYAANDHANGMSASKGEGLRPPTPIDETLEHRKANVWELYGVKSRTARKTLEKAAHDCLQQVLPVHQEPLTPRKHASIYIAVLTTLAEDYCDCKAKL